jgi:pyrroloquinoline quinone (PQQ) biosynthesis protein C
MAVATKILTPREVQEKVEELYQLGQRLYGELIENHPVTRAIQGGTLPPDVLKAFALNWYLWGYPISYAYPEIYKRFNDYFKRMPDLENIVTIQAAKELSRPIPGGLPRALEAFAVTAGNTREELLDTIWIYPEIGGFRDFIVRLYRDGTFAEVAALQVGNILPRFARQVSRGLQTHYGFGAEGLGYWQALIEAESSPAQEGGYALGAPASNKYILKRVLESEPLIDRIDFGIDYVAEMSVRMFHLFLNAIKKHYWDRTGYGAGYGR